MLMRTYTTVHANFPTLAGGFQGTAHMNRTLPNFFIVGAAKSGTTSMYRYLEQHPDVYMPSFKEPHWFARVEPSSGLIVHSVTSEAEYLRLFEGWKGERAIGEASPSYLWDDAAPGRIQEEVPDAKIIVLLRDPVSRAFSHYLMDVREGMEERPFLRALQEDYASHEKGWGISHLYVELGMYCEQISRYLDCFGRENVLVLFFEEVFADPYCTLRGLGRTLNFLGVDPTVPNSVDLQRRYNPHAVPRGGFSQSMLRASGLRSMARRLLPERSKQFLREKVLLRQVEKPDADPQAVEFLRRIYAPETACLESVLGRELPWEFATG